MSSAALLPGSRHRPALGAAVGTAGALLAVAGVWTTASSQALQLITMDYPITQVLTNAATELAPPALVAAGLVLVLAGLAGWFGDRVLGATAAAAGVLLGAIACVALLANALQPLSYRGGTVQKTPLWAAGVVGLATVLLVVVVARWWFVGARPTAVASRSARTGRRRAVRWSALAVLVLVIAAAGVWSRDRVSDRLDLAVLFPDPSLAGCVASALGIPAGRQVSERELSGVTQLTCQGDLDAGVPISSLTGIDALPGLSGLELTTNAVSDLGPLTGLPELRSLALSNNVVSDLTPLARLPLLADLGLSGNQVSDLIPLAGLTALRHLGLAGNQVSDLTPLAGLTQLEDVDLYDNQVSDVLPLAGLSRLDHLTLNRNQVTDPSPLCRLPALTHLDLSFNQVADAGTLTGCQAVEQLSLGANPLTDLTPLLELTSLLGVDLSETDPTGITGIDHLRAKGVYVGGPA